MKVQRLLSTNPMFVPFDLSIFFTSANLICNKTCVFYAGLSLDYGYMQDEKMHFPKQK